jgi:MYXO-CTERM domain-containing protein
MAARNNWQRIATFCLVGALGTSMGAGEAKAQASKTLAEADWVTEDDRGESDFGPVVSPAGDVNADGFADVLVGSAFYKTEAGGEGRVVAYYGSETGLQTSPGWVVDSDKEGAYLGEAVSSAGDVNADGYDDILVAAPSEDDSGRVYLYLGASTGLTTTPAWTAASTQASTTFARAVSSAGDVNADGYDDVIIGDPFYDGDFQNSGRAHLYLGSADGLQADPAWVADPSSNKTAFFGWSVSDAGDVNGDGYDDVIVGEIRYTNGQEREGRAHVFYGSESGLQDTAAWTKESDLEEVEYGWSVSGAGDVNGDGYDDVLVGARLVGDSWEGEAYLYLGSEDGLAQEAAWTAPYEDAGARLGSSVSRAGDLDADGYADVVIGAPSFSDGETLAVGKILIYHGSASGLADRATWTAQADIAHTKFGWSATGAGDVNGDGADDILAAVRVYKREEGTDDGAYVFHSEPPEPGSDAGADAGVDAGSDAGAADAATSQTNTNASDGCGCSSTGGPRGAGSALVLIALLGLVRLRKAFY